MPQSDYTFGDTDLAARRLELVGKTFEDTTRRFLLASAPNEPALAVDLGSGPGHTTVLLRETLHPALTVAVDFSPAYVEQTAARAGGDGVEAIEADVLDLPEKVTGAEVIFVRLLLTHLRDPLAAVALWRERLAPGLDSRFLERPQIIEAVRQQGAAAAFQCRNLLRPEKSPRHSHRHPVRVA